MKTNVITVISAALLLCCGCARSTAELIDFQSVNRQATEEYQIPIRNGYKGRMPFWNRFADKYIFAPAFDFKEVDGAKSYRFTVKYVDGIYPGKPRYFWDGYVEPTYEENIENLPDMGDGQVWSFIADSPKADLSPIWKDITPGNVALKVEALDSGGQVIGVSGGEFFLRDFPFKGPYHDAVRSYKDAAILAANYIHSLPQVQHWLAGEGPDATFKYYSYACKIIGGLISSEVMLANLVPAKKDECLEIARAAADFLIGIEQGEDKPLAHFPPTYYKDFHPTAVKYAGTTMMMEATKAAEGYLDLYDCTGEKKYFDEALAIALTYKRVQCADGSFPIKVDFETGEPLNEAKATPGNVLNLWRVMESKYGVKDFAGSREKCEKWMLDCASSNFDLTGQFEDVDVLGLEPFQNLNNSTYSGYAKYLYDWAGPDDKTLQMCRDFMALTEDQFVHWDRLPCKDGFVTSVTPCVFEQYLYKTPIDASASMVGRAFLSQYRATGDKLALAKAKALADACTIAQNPVTGRCNTHWEIVPQDKRTIWFNCSMVTCKFWLEMAETIDGLQGQSAF